jgi:predicted RNase H-like HicB family nuclease
MACGTRLKFTISGPSPHFVPLPDAEIGLKAMAGCVNLKVKLPKSRRDTGIEECRPMNTEYSAVTKQDGGWWIGWIVEVPGVNCQERTHEELLDSLKITLQEALEFNREEALKAAGENYREEKIAV